MGHRGRRVHTVAAAESELACGVRTALDDHGRADTDQPGDRGVVLLPDQAPLSRLAEGDAALVVLVAAEGGDEAGLQGRRGTQRRACLKQQHVGARFPSGERDQEPRHAAAHHHDAPR